jgi:hypothetical protein
VRQRFAFVTLLSLGIAPMTAAAGEMPEGWISAGSHPDQYEMGTDPDVKHGGEASASLRAKSAESEGFGTLMQMADPGEYRGKRVRFSGWVKAEGVSDWAGLWFRVDGPGNKALSFDNMQGRPIKGTGDWTLHEIVLDVPDEAVALAYGVLLSGAGHVWMDDLQFEIVAADVPVTGSRGGTPPTPPQNLSFEQ